MDAFELPSGDLEVAWFRGSTGQEHGVVVAP
jgi:hypothetical protein